MGFIYLENSFKISGPPKRRVFGNSTFRATLYGTAFKEMDMPRMLRQE